MALIDSIIAAERGSTPDAKNPNSTAMGDGQFLEGTWLDTLAKYRPDLTGTREQLLAMRADPALSKSMTEAYAAQNAGILSSAGLPVTPGSTYLAHFAGPKGAIGILNADPSIPAGAILGDRVVQANPFLKNMTAADLRAWADKKMGAKPSAEAPLSMASALPVATAPASSSGLPLGLAGISDNPSEIEAQAPLTFGAANAEQSQAPPPMFLPPKARFNLSNLRPQAPAQRRGFSFRG